MKMTCSPVRHGLKVLSLAAATMPSLASISNAEELNAPTCDREQFRLKLPSIPPQVQPERSPSSSWFDSPGAALAMAGFIAGLRTLGWSMKRKILREQGSSQESAPQSVSEGLNTDTTRNDQRWCDYAALLGEKVSTDTRE